MITFQRMPERIRFSAQDTDSLSQAVEKAVTVLEQGGVMLYPTDTIYGLGADATNRGAIETINQIKDRDESKAQLILASDVAMAEMYGSFHHIAKKLAATFWPGPLTILVPKTEVLPDVLTAGSLLVGIRVPDHAFCVEVTRKFGRPITSTSANISGRQPAATVDEILKTFGDNARDIDLVIEEADRVITDPTPSTLVKIEGDRVAILREGAVPRQAIEALQK